MTGMPAWRAIGATVSTDLANSGPRMSPAPALTASSAAALAPSGVPLSSLMMSCRVGLSRSNSGRSSSSKSAREQSEFGRLLKALADQTGLAGRRHRQDEGDLDQLLTGRSRGIALALQRRLTLHLGSVAA